MAFDISTLDLRRLAQIGYIANTAGAHVTNAASKRTVVQLIILHNTDSSAITVTLYNVPDSSGSVGSASAANQFYKASVGAGETVQLEFLNGIVLEDTNDTIQAVAGTGSKVTIQAYGKTFAV